MGQQGWVSRTALGAGIALLVLLSNRERLEDWLNYVPPAPSDTIAQLAAATTMTPKAQRLFYRQAPAIEPRDRVLQQCDVPQTSIVLGCYIQETRGGAIARSNIVIQQVDDPKLQGTMEVTAAHEMLHAVYNRLSLRQQLELADRLTVAAKRVTDTRLIKTLEQYRAKNRDLYHNELHSHLGTELAELGDPWLEEHYQRYFGDRQQVVALAQQSSRIITELEQRAEALKLEIQQLETELSQEQSQIQQTETRLEESSRTLDRLQAQLQQNQASLEIDLQRNSLGVRQKIQDFEQEASSFNQQVNDHNEQVKQQRDRIAQFNQKVETYQAKVDTYNQVAKESMSVLESLRGPLPNSAKRSKEALP